MDAGTIASLIVSALALLSSLTALCISINQFSKTRKANFYNLIYDCLKPVSVFIYDALYCKDFGEDDVNNNAEYPDTKLIDEAEKQLFSNFDALYSYGVGEELPYLRQFATLNISDSVENHKLLNSMCFFHILSLIEDKYIKSRRKIAGKKINLENNTKFQFYIDIFRTLLYIQSNYAIKVLYKKEKKVKTKHLLEYYSELRNCYGDDHKKQLISTITEYGKTHDDKWYDMYLKLKGGTIDGKN